MCVSRKNGYLIICNRRAHDIHGIIITATVWVSTSLKSKGSVYVHFQGKGERSMGGGRGGGGDGEERNYWNGCHHMQLNSNCCVDYK